MRVVSNTSPISNLAVIARLDLLPRRYERVHVPEAVARELARLRHMAARTRIEAALGAGWLRIESIALPQLSLPFPLDAGETAAIAMAVAIRADVLLLDEKRGRVAARHVGIPVAGILGELLHAKLAGWIPAVAPELQKLRSDAGFFIDPAIEKFILSQSGE